jgi:tRNA nucleotidyltransferase (CCA-adding enzyme)
MKMMKISVPKEVRCIGDALVKGGYEAYLVGGCVRDLVLKREPKDWDVTTSARPEEIQKIFPESVYENEFGTVGVKTGSEEGELKVVEVTTFRIEGKYTDKRHPDQVDFARTIEEDLNRRDFTVNALAFDLGKKGEIVDFFDGIGDLKKKLVRAVGDPHRRFEEDALRLVRAVRFATELGFEIEKETADAIRDKAGLLEVIAKERIRDEFTKIIMASRAADGVVMLEDLGLLKFIMPELREGIGCGQNKHHIYTVFDHLLRSLNYAAEKNYSFVVRLAALLHDVGKPKTKAGDGINSTFYNHEAVGARMTLKILDRLRFSKEVVEKVTHLVRFHFFYYNVGEVTEAGVRRFLRRVGPENVGDLIKVREADRIGSGTPKAVPYKLRHLLFMIDKVKKDPIHPKMLKLNGEDVMKILKIEPGRKIGQILAILLEEVLDDKGKNEKKYLTKRTIELNEFSEKDLMQMAEKARDKKDEFEGGIEAEMKKRHFVK